tara:strand:+ start:696 stop:875 length:180 start_codon:yes stop_codon:yes gene_type:complete
MKSIQIDLQIGDKISVGKFRNIRKTITDIKLDDYGQPVIVTDDEKERKALSFRLAKLDQ